MKGLLQAALVEKSSMIGPWMRRPLAAFNLAWTINEKALKALKGIHKGRRAFVIGNGPSLRYADLDRLSAELTFASNKIYLAFSHTDWRPTYYAAEDALFGRQHRKCFEGLLELTKLFPYYFRKFIPQTENCIYYWLVHRDFYPHLPRFSSNPLSRLYWGGTVTYTLIQFAVFMGIQEIYLLGVDCDYQIDQHSVVLERNQAFYRSQGEHNYFHPDYVHPGEKNHHPNLLHHRNAFKAARLALESRGGTLANATRGGKLDVLERVDFDRLLCENQQKRRSLQ